MTISLLVMVVGLLFLPRLRWLGEVEARRRLKKGAILLDVRSPMEVATTKVDGAVTIPLANIPLEVGGRNWPRNQEILVFCASGVRSAAAVRELKKMGYTKAVNLGSLGRAQALVSGT